MPFLRVAREHAVQAVEQLARAHRLGQIGREAERREALNVAVAIHRGEHHHARVRQLRIGVDALAERCAVHVVHLVVGEHDFERMLVAERLAQQAQGFDRRRWRG